jgi:hypothetical protein
MELRETLPYIFLGEHLGDGELLCRLAGTQIAEFLGFDLTGHTTEKNPILNKGQKIILRELVTKLLAQPCGLIIKCTVPHSEEEPWSFDILCLPMRNDENEAELVLASAYIAPLKGKEYTARAGSFDSSKLMISNSEFIDIGAGVPQ